MQQSPFCSFARFALSYRFLAFVPGIVGGILLVALGWSPLFAQTPTNTVSPTPSITRRATTPTPRPTPRSTSTPFPRPPTTPVTNTIYLPLTGNQGVVYLPLVNSSGAQTQRPQGEMVYGLLGLLEAAPNRGDSQQLHFPNGKSYALLGASNAIKTELEKNAASPPNTVVKVWGTLYQSAAATQTAYVVVTDVVVVRQLAVTPSRTPTATPTAAPPSAIGRFDQVNLRDGPGSAYSRSGVIMMGDVCPVVGRNGADVWILINCPSGATGWIEARLVKLQGALSAAPVIEPQATPTPTFTPSPTPLPVSTLPAYAFRGWKALYYANMQLIGVPVAVSDVAEIDFNWGSGAPVAGVPVDAFSILFERTVEFAPGFYFFTIEADDGVRLFVDGQLVVDQWYGPAGQVYHVGRQLGGRHDLRVEYNEVGGAARLRVAIQQAPLPMRWDATYFVSPGGAGEIVLSQSEPDGGAYRIDYNWGAGGPFSAPADNWSARWVGRYRFEAGNYVFYAQAEDGVRVAIDGQLVINKWTDGYALMSNRFLGVGGEEHTITVEYFDRIGNASLRVWWVKEASASNPQ